MKRNILTGMILVAAFAVLCAVGMHFEVVQADTTYVNVPAKTAYFDLTATNVNTTGTYVTLGSGTSEQEIVVHGRGDHLGVTVCSGEGTGPAIVSAFRVLAKMHPDDTFDTYATITTSANFKKHAIAGTLGARAVTGTLTGNFGADTNGIVTLTGVSAGTSTLTSVVVTDSENPLIEHLSDGWASLSTNGCESAVLECGGVYSVRFAATASGTDAVAAVTVRGSVD